MSQADTAVLEQVAFSFASEFLMPAASILEYLRQNPSVEDVIQTRSQFKVSAMALAFAAHRAGRMSEWAYRNCCIELSQRGFRKDEPGGMPTYEISRVFTQILDRERSSNITARTIANDLHLPISDVHALTFGVELRTAQETEVLGDSEREIPAERHLRVV